MLLMVACGKNPPADQNIKKPYMFNSNSLKKHVKALVNTKSPRNHLHPETLIEVSNYIHKEFSGMGLKPSFQEFKVDENNYRNILAIINPQAKKIVVIGAHYDVCGEQSGTDDNASGVAGLLELARYAKVYEPKISYQIQFVAYANEEPPFFRTNGMGSYVHAKDLHDKKTNLKLMICLEMIGYFTDKKKTQDYPLSLLKLFYPTKGNFIAVVSNYDSGKYRKLARKTILKNSNIPCRSLSAPSALPGIDFSDHLNYWKFGYKAIMITDTSFYRNKNYHQKTDTIDTLDFNKMNEVVKGLAAYLLKLSF